MSRTMIVVAMIAASLAAVPAARAQPAEKVYRVGYILPRPVAEITSNPTHPFNSAFRQEMRQRGYLEGRNLVLELRSVEGRIGRVSEVVSELVRMNVDVIVAVSQPVVQAAQQATRTIPIVMFGVGDPVSTGLVVSLARPGGNITGLSQLSPELSAKRLALLKEVIPELSRVAVLSNPTNPSNAPQIRDTKAAAKALGVELQLLEVGSPQDLESAFQAAARGRADALVTLDDLFIYTHRTRIVALAAKSRLPGAYGWSTLAEVGGLMSYGPDFRDMYTKAAVFVDKILRGAKPATLPIEQPTKFELVVNLKTAKALGLMIPPSLRLRADHIIE